MAHTRPPYGSAPNPGAPGTWDRAVWVALNRSARVGAGTGRHRWRCVPPFTTSEGLYVTAAVPKLPYGRSTVRKAHLTHLTHTVLFAWQGGRLRGRMMAWHCGSRTAYFHTLDEPDSPLCVPCQFRAIQASGQVPQVVAASRT